MVIPFQIDRTEPMVERFCEFAERLRATYGFISYETSQVGGQAAALGGSMTEEAAPPGTRLLSPDRRAYRRAPWALPSKIGAGIGGPEWGTMLGPDHVELLSVADLKSSGAFARIQSLAHGGLYLQLSLNPQDTQAAIIEDLVAKAREALGPILLDVSE